MKESNNGRFCSKRLIASNISGVQYYLTIYPNGDCEDRRGKVWIFLYVSLENESKVKVDSKFCIESAGWTDKLSEQYLLSKGRGFSPCGIADLFDPAKKFIVNGKLIIECDGYLSVEKPRPKDGNTLDAGHIGRKLWMNDDKDFTIHVGNESIKVSLFVKCIKLLNEDFRSINLLSRLSHSY